MVLVKSPGKPGKPVVRRLLGGALPIAVLAVSARLLAGDASNTASLILPAGVDDTNPSNNTATSVTPVNARLIAGPDSASGIAGFTGAPNVLNVLGGDMLNGAPATLSLVTLTIAPGSSVPAGLTFDPTTGQVGVVPGTAAGTYSFDYTICETGRPDNCQRATVTVQVIAAPIAAGNDQPPPVNAATGGTGVVNVLTNDTLNGQTVDPARIVLTVLTPATPIGGGSVPVLDPVTGQVNVPPGTPPGSYPISYQICERLNPTNCATGVVTIVVDPARSNLSGTVYTDVNGDRQIDPGDTRLPGWIVEVLLNGQVVGTATSDAQGNYSFTGLRSGPGYAVRFRDPENSVVYGQIAAITLGVNQTVVDQNLPIDPSGVVYDSVSRTPLAGVRLTLTDAGGTPLPEACFLDPSQRDQLTGASGQYRFDITPGAAAQCPVGESIYRIVVTPRSGYSAPSSVLMAQPGPLDPTGQGSPYFVAASPNPPTDNSATYYLTFRLQSGDPNVIHNHLPLDPFLTRSPLVVTKTSPRRSATTGDLVPYEITVRNTEAVQRAGVDVIDVLPPGMKYVAHSASIDGVAAEPVAANSGRELVWHGQVIPAGGSVRYSLTLIVGAGVAGGERVNTGLAENTTSGAEISNRGTASVTITPSSLFDCSELLGKVFEDTNRNGYQDEGEPGVPGARLATVNGQLVTTDQYGRYHIACAAVPDSRIGSNYVLKLDLRTVPLGWEATTDNPRSIRLTRGKFGELNFGVAPPSQENASTTRKGGE